MFNTPTVLLRANPQRRESETNCSPTTELSTIPCYFVSAAELKASDIFTKEDIPVTGRQTRRKLRQYSACMKKLAYRLRLQWRQVLFDSVRYVYDDVTCTIAQNWSNCVSWSDDWLFITECNLVVLHVNARSLLNKIECVFQPAYGMLWPTVNLCQ